MKINREELLKALASTKSGLANKEIVEQTGSYLFVDGRVITYNDEVSVSAPTPEGLDIRGAVPAKELHTLLNKITEAELEIVLDDNKLTIKNGNRKLNAKFSRTAEIKLPLDELPKAEDSSWIPLGMDFVQMAKLVLYTVSKNMAKPVLTCVHWHDNMLESSDNLRISQCTISTVLPAGVSILIPGGSLAALLKFNPTAVSIVDGWLHFKTSDNAIFSCRTFDGTFPDVNRLLSMECNTPISFGPRLPGILDRAMVLADKDSVGDHKVDITVQDNTCTVSASKDVGSIEESCGIRCEHNFVFSVNPAALKEILELPETTANTSEKGMDEGRPCFLKFMAPGFVFLMAIG